MLGRDVDCEWPRTSLRAATSTPAAWFSLPLHTLGPISVGDPGREELALGPRGHHPLVQELRNVEVAIHARPAAKLDFEDLRGAVVTDGKDHRGRDALAHGAVPSSSWRLHQVMSGRGSLGVSTALAMGGLCSRVETQRWIHGASVGGRRGTVNPTRRQ